jgi:hypothetical protein
MTGALTVAEAFGPTLEETLLHALEQSRRPARTATCPVCHGTMRRLPSQGGDSSGAADELACGECDSVLVDLPAATAGQLRLVR